MTDDDKDQWQTLPLGFVEEGLLHCTLVTERIDFITAVLPWNVAHFQSINLYLTEICSFQWHSWVFEVKEDEGVLMVNRGFHVGIARRTIV